LAVGDDGDDEGSFAKHWTDPLYDFALRRNRTFDGQEESEEYSDDEGDPDHLSSKRDRKEAVLTLLANGWRLGGQFERLLREKTNNSDIQVGPPSIAFEGIVHSVAGIVNHTEAVEDAARLAPERHTALRVVTAQDYDPVSGSLSDVVRTTLCYDGRSILREHFNSKRWKGDCILGCISFTFGALLLYIAWQGLSIYL
jgi:hypothetical protein